MSSQEQVRSVRFTQAQRKAIAEFPPDLADRRKLEERNSPTLRFTADELRAIRQKAEAAIPHAETGRLRNSLRRVADNRRSYSGVWF